MTEEYLKKFSYTSLCTGFNLDLMNPKLEIDQSAIQSSSDPNADTTHQSSALIGCAEAEEPQKRKLRSYRSDDCDIILENCLSSIASTSSGASTPLHVTSNAILTANYCKSLGNNMPAQIKEFMHSLLSWKILPANATPTACMIFGAQHLARLIGRFIAYCIVGISVIF